MTRISTAERVWSRFGGAPFGSEPQGRRHRGLVFIAAFLAVLVGMALAAGGCRSVDATNPVAPVPGSGLSQANVDAEAVRAEVSAEADALVKLAATGRSKSVDEPNLSAVWDGVEKTAAALRALAGRLSVVAVRLRDALAQIEADGAKIKELSDRVADLEKEAASREARMWRWLTVLGIAVASVGAGVGFWIKNLRLSLAAVISGGVAVVGVMLAGALAEWSWMLALAVAVVVAVIGVCFVLEWRKTGSFFGTVKESVAPKTTEKVKPAPND